MDMIDCDGQAKSLDLFGMTDRFDLFNQVRRHHWPEDAAVQSCPPREMIVQLIVSTASQVIARYFSRILGKRVVSKVGRTADLSRKPARHSEAPSLFYRLR
jgi:hypothetical protein